MKGNGRDPDARPTVPPAPAAAVMGSLYAHPHDDTPQAIAAVIGDPQVDATAISEALEALQSSALVHTDGLHWQLTAAAYRKHHEVARRN
jgi:hypothetical protein